MYLRVTILNEIMLYACKCVVLVDKVNKPLQAYFRYTMN